jgi:hypothetical protein
MRIADYIAKQRRDIARFNRVVSAVSTVAFGSLVFVSNHIGQMRIWLFLLIALLVSTFLVGARMGSRVRCPGCQRVLVKPRSQVPERDCPSCGLDFNRAMPD